MKNLLLFVGEDSSSSILSPPDWLMLGFLMLLVIGASCLTIHDLYYKYKSRKMQLDITKFTKSVGDWSDEIIDESIRRRFLSTYVTYLLINFEKFNLKEEKDKLYKEWGKYIPSLIQEYRNEKLKKLL